MQKIQKTNRLRYQEQKIALAQQAIAQLAEINCAYFSQCEVIKTMREEAESSLLARIQKLKREGLGRLSLMQKKLKEEEQRAALTKSQVQFRMYVLKRRLMGCSARVAEVSAKVDQLSREIG